MTTSHLTSALGRVGLVVAAIAAVVGYAAGYADAVLDTPMCEAPSDTVRAITTIVYDTVHIYTPSRATLDSMLRSQR